MKKPEVTLLPHELFEEIQNLDGYKKREELLKEKGNNFNVKTILQLAYNDKVVLDIPEGTPPFNEDKAPATFQPQGLKKALSQLGLCVKNSRITGKHATIKKQKVFIGILECLHPKDAEILCAAKDGKLEKMFPKVSKNLLERVWPELL
jgi:hypothetical protein